MGARVELEGLCSVLKGCPISKPAMKGAHSLIFGEPDESRKHIKYRVRIFTVYYTLSKSELRGCTVGETQIGPETFHQWPEDFSLSWSEKDQQPYLDIFVVFTHLIRGSLSVCCRFSVLHSQRGGLGELIKTVNLRLPRESSFHVFGV